MITAGDMPIGKQGAKNGLFARVWGKVKFIVCSLYLPVGGAWATAINNNDRE
jgi:hypothetical protein